MTKCKSFIKTTRQLTYSNNFKIFCLGGSLLIREGMTFLFSNGDVDLSKPIV